MDNRIHIALATDANYLKHASVMLASLLHHIPADDDSDIHVHVLNEHLTDDEKGKLKKLQDTFSFQLHFLDLKSSFLADWKLSRQLWTNAIYYRLALPSILPEVDRVIYLDCDIVVLDNIRKLWETDLSGYSIAAAPVPVKKSYQETLGLNPEFRYFNSGVMVFDLKKMRETQTEKKFIEIYKRQGETLKYPDQDILNLAYEKDGYKMLQLRWNLTSHFYRNNPKDTPEFPIEEIKEALSNPAVAHYTGRHKPWNVFQGCRHPYWEYYWKYLKLSPFSAEYPKFYLKKLAFCGYLKAPHETVPWDKSIIQHNL